MQWLQLQLSWGVHAANVSRVEPWRAGKHDAAAASNAAVVVMTFLCALVLSISVVLLQTDWNDTGQVTVFIYRHDTRNNRPKAINQ
jgi:hypothetical protein